MLNDGYYDQAVERCGDHRPAGPLRGGKYSMYDGGTRVPFILSWPGRVNPGASQALVSQVDFLASFAALAGVSLDSDAGPDSANVLDALLGQSDEGRAEIVLEGIQAKTVLRQNDWVFIPPHEGPPVNTNVNIETGNAPAPQLYDLSGDIGQIENVASAHPDLAEQMANRLRDIRASQRTTPRHREHAR